MLTVTDAAKELLGKLLERAHESGAACIRLKENKSESLVLEAGVKSPDDVAVTHDGQDVLIFDSEISSKYDGTTIDATQTPEGPKLHIVG